MVFERVPNYQHFEQQVPRGKGTQMLGCIYEREVRTKKIPCLLERIKNYIEMMIKFLNEVI